MKKKIGLLLFAMLISFCFINVEAKTVWKVFLVGCEESEKAYQEYFGKKLTKSGSYPVEVDDSYKDIDGKFDDSSSTSGCGPSTSGNLACSFGCLEEAVDNANDPYKIGNTKDLFDAFGETGNNVNSYCKEVCFDKKQFIAPENNSITVKQGTRFNWLNSEGHILTLKDDRTCITFFDYTSWKSAYNTAKDQIVSITGTLRNKQSYTAYCKSGYKNENGSCVSYTTVVTDSYVATCRVGFANQNGKCVSHNGLEYSLCNNGYKYEDGKCKLYSQGKKDSYSLCDTGYKYNNGSCVMTDEYKKDLLSRRSNAVIVINGLIGDANSCYNHTSNPITACDNVKISYGDEVYGAILDNDNEANKLKLSGGSNTISNTVNGATTNSVSNYDCSDSSPYGCEVVSKTVSILKSRTMVFYTEYNWDLQDDVFSCVDINGYSHLKCEYAENFSGTSNYFGKYQNYIKLGSNLPVNFNSAVGEHEIYIDYGCENAVNNTCSYNVSKCPDGICIPADCDPSVEDCDGGNDDNDGNGIDVIYRVIDLNNPFPNRTPGYNWNITGLVDRYITNNRNVKTEAVYSTEPMYTIELDPALIKEIRNSNKDVNYGDLDLYCTDGVKCRSSYLRELRDNGHLSGCGTLDDFDACEVGG